MATGPVVPNGNRSGKKQEQGAGSREQGAGSRERGARSEEKD